MELRGMMNRWGLLLLLIGFFMGTSIVAILNLKIYFNELVPPPSPFAVEIQGTVVYTAPSDSDSKKRPEYMEVYPDYWNRKYLCEYRDSIQITRIYWLNLTHGEYALQFDSKSEQPVVVVTSCAACSQRPLHIVRNTTEYQLTIMADDALCTDYRAPPSKDSETRHTQVRSILTNLPKDTALMKNAEIQKQATEDTARGWDEIGESDWTNNETERLLHLGYAWWYSQRARHQILFDAFGQCVNESLTLVGANANNTCLMPPFEELASVTKLAGRYNTTSPTQGFGDNPRGYTTLERIDDEIDDNDHQLGQMNQNLRRCETAQGVLSEYMSFQEDYCAGKDTNGAVFRRGVLVSLALTFFLLGIVVFQIWPK